MVKKFCFLFIFLLFNKCTVTSADIEKWKSTQKGPDKLAALLLDDKYTPRLRAEAAWALASIGDWNKFDKAFRVIPADKASKIVDELAPILKQVLSEGNKPPSPPTADQVSAKDALYVVYPLARGRTKEMVEEALIDWSISDFNGRFFAGRYSIEVIVTAIGTKAARGLSKTLKPDFLAYDKVSEIISKIGTTEDREEAGKMLLKIAEERKGKVEEPLLVAMGRMGGKEVRNYLLKLGADLKIPARVQRGALIAYLQFKLCNKEDLEALFAIAEDINQDYTARNYAYDAIVCVGDKTQVPRLTKLLHETGKDKDKFRGVGVDEILKLGGAETIPLIISHIESEKDPWENFEDLRDFVMIRFATDDEGKPLNEEGKKKVLDQLRPLLKGKGSIARAISAFTIGLIGEKSDIEFLKKMFGDSGKLKGWEAKEGEIMVGEGRIMQFTAMNFKTVGDVAKWASEQIAKR